MKIVKKILIGLLICICAAPILMGLLFYAGMFTAMAVNYSEIDWHSGDGFAYLIRDGFKKAGVCKYTYDPASGNTVIEIPESYGDYPVRSLGGYVGKGGPCPFYIELKDVHSTAGVSLSRDSFDWYLKNHDLEPVYVDCKLQIGPNIREIYAAQSGIEAGDKLYIVRVYVDCDSENRWFYSENGVLYHKNGEVVDGFLYWNREYMTES